MKYVYLALIFCVVTACSDSEDSCNKQEYGQEFNIGVGESVCFDDGNSFELLDVVDEFCCCFCNCIWEGELRITVERTNQAGDKLQLTFGSSTFDIKDKIFEGYKIGKIDYLYNRESDSLPLCEGVYDSKNIELIFEISPI